jgi:hypothetical protein
MRQQQLCIFQQAPAVQALQLQLPFLPDDKNSLIKLARPVPQRVLALKLQAQTAQGCLMLEAAADPIAGPESALRVLMHK